MLERPHVVETVGELHQQHADVARHRHEHLAEGLRLAVLLGGEVHLAELGHAIDQEGHLGTEELLDVLLGDVRVLDHVVEQGGADAGGIEPHLRDDARDAGRVDEVGIAGLPHLPRVHPLRVGVGTVDQIGVRLGVVLPNLGHEILDGRHAVSRISPGITQKGNTGLRPRQRSDSVLTHAGRTSVKIVRECG